MNGGHPRVDVGLPLLRLGAWVWVAGTVQFFVVHLVVERAWPEP